MADDLLPEEREDQEMMTLLRRGLGGSVPISDFRQPEMIADVRERLLRTDKLSSQVLPVPGQITARRIVSLPSRTRRRTRLLSGLVAVLVVGILGVTAFTLLRIPLHQNITSPLSAPTLPGPSATTQVNNLKASIHIVTPGPYFLSELLAVDVSLTNHTQASLTLDGSAKPHSPSCNQDALVAQMSGGSLPFYHLPSLPGSVCLDIGYMTRVTSNQTLTMRHYLPLTKSGTITITMRGQVSFPDILNEHGPSVQIHVAPQVPASRKLAVHEQGAQVSVQVPQAAHVQLFYQYSIYCDNYAGDGSDIWSPLPGATLSQPNCPTPHPHWNYIVSAPGYSIVSGSQSS